MSNFDKAIEIIMAEPPEPRYPEYYASLLRQADVPDKDDGKCSESPNSSETIYRQAAIDAINCDITITGKRNAEVVAETIAKFVDRIKALPPAQPEVTEEAVKDYCRKRCMTILTNDYFHKLTSAQPEKRTEERAETHSCDLMPPAQPERILYANMSDAEFEKWLYEHGICNPNIHESIPCDAVPLLIDSAISEWPSAQLERKKGKWIVDALANNIYHCSECGTDAPVEPTGGTEYKSNYCPYCGLDMRGETDED